MFASRTVSRFLIATSVLANIFGCSQSIAPKPTQTENAAFDNQPSAAELAALYDPSLLVETKSLKGFPLDLQSTLGVHSTTSPPIADVGEPCNPGDVVSNAYPDRCFLLGGLSDTSALVAYKVGGYEGQWEIAATYVRTKSGWAKIGQVNIGYPNSLSELKEMNQLATEREVFKRKAPPNY